MAEPAFQGNVATGVILATIGGLMISIDVPLIRLGHGDVWSVMTLRALCTGFAGVSAWYLLNRFGKRQVRLVPGWSGAAVGLLYSLSSLTFIAAVHMTPTANLVLILAFNMAFAALFARVFLGEKMATPTLLAMSIMFLAVFVIVGDGLSAGHSLGDFLALAASALIAGAIILTRASGRDMSFVAVSAQAIVLLISVPMVLWQGFNVAEPVWIVLDGLIVIPIAFFCLGLAPRHLPGPEVAMFYLIETVLAPVWVYLIFSEAPTSAVMMAGAVMIVTLAAHSWWQVQAGRKRRAALAARHP
jgi:drug/metabolite transporter (DMT)-like permease